MPKDSKDTKENKAPDAPNPDLPKDNQDAAGVTKKEAPKAVPKKTVKVLHVVAKREGFRRAGFVFGSDRTRLVVDDLTSEQVKQLKEESMLVVTESTEEV